MFLGKEWAQQVTTQLSCYWCQDCPHCDALSWCRQRYSPHWSAMSESLWYSRYHHSLWMNFWHCRICHKRLWRWWSGWPRDLWWRSGARWSGMAVKDSILWHFLTIHHFVRESHFQLKGSCSHIADGQSDEVLINREVEWLPRYSWNILWHSV